MNEERLQWQSTVYGILPHPTAPSVLMLPDEDNLTWSLPQILLKWRMGFSAVRPVTRGMTDLFGFPVTALALCRAMGGRGCPFVSGHLHIGEP